MIIPYIFTINDVSVEPYYSEDLSDVYTVVTNQRYISRELLGTIKLIGPDYDWINLQPFNTKFFFNMFELRGSTYHLYYSATFSKTDCMWDIDDKAVTIKLTTNDGLDKILAVLDKEVNLVDLQSNVERANYVTRPIVQSYILGAETLTNFSTAASWEQDVDAPVLSATDLQNVFHFKRSSTMFECSVSGSMTPDVTGGYAGADADSPAFSDERKYRIEFALSGGSLKIYDNNTNVLLFDDPSPFINDYPYIVTLQPIAGVSTGNPTVYVNERAVYSRVILNTDTFDGVATLPIPTIDIVAPHRNYKRCLGITDNTMIASAESSVEPSQYGRNDFRQYFQPPAIAGRYFLPFARSSWGNVSYWFDPIYLRANFDILGSTVEILYDAYPIHEVISGILSKFSTGLTFDDTTAHSEFLYATVNPIPGATRFSLLITQKTNIMINGYDRAAQKSPITLKDIFDMLLGVYKCYWFLDGTKVRIETTSWFSNGRSYSGTPEVGLNLEAAKDPKNKLPLGFGQNKYTYDKSTMPERIQFAWGDKSNELFNGYPIEVINDYVSKGLIENVNINKFISDFDYALQNYTTLSSDGFAILACIVSNLFNKNSPNVLYNAYIDPSTGDYVTDPSYNVTGWMPVDPTHVYIVSHRHSISFVDEFGVFISGLPEGTETNIVPPPTASLMRCSVLKTEWDSYSVTDGYVKYQVPLVDVTVDGHTHKLQNGYLSFVSVQPLYYVYDAPARTLTINHVNVDATSVKRNKVQNVIFPVAGVDFNKQIKTLIGNGFVDKISLNLSSQIAKTTLRYETEQ